MPRTNLPHPEERPKGASRRTRDENAADPAMADDLAAAVRRGDRRALARAVTLVESTRPDHRRAAEALIAALLPATGGAARNGITGPPGAAQSATAVADIVDMFLLILPPAAGDDLQGIKRGIVELADLVLVNKADGALLDHATRSAADYTNALRLIRPAGPEWQATARAVSALTGSGIDAVWEDVAHFRAALQATGAWDRRRAEQARAALWAEIGDALT